jgi:hypothetical protein
MRLAAVLFFLCAGAACSSLEKSAREDPMKCERDPKCEKKRGRQADCSMQCSDDPACVERCEQIQQQNGKLGH